MNEIDTPSCRRKRCAAAFCIQVVGFERRFLSNLLVCMCRRKWELSEGMEIQRLERWLVIVCWVATALANGGGGRERKKKRFFFFNFDFLLFVYKFLKILGL